MKTSLSNLSLLKLFQPKVHSFISHLPGKRVNLGRRPEDGRRKRAINNKTNYAQNMTKQQQVVEVHTRRRKKVAENDKLPGVGTAIYARNWCRTSRKLKGIFSCDLWLSLHGSIASVQLEQCHQCLINWISNFMSLKWNAIPSRRDMLHRQAKGIRRPPKFAWEPATCSDKSVYEARFFHHQSKFNSVIWSRELRTSFIFSLLFFRGGKSS